MKFTTLFLDMDGVIADWITAIELAHKRTAGAHYSGCNYRGKRLQPRDWGMEWDDFWSPCRKHKFWANIPVMPDAHEIVKIIENYFPPEDVVILSTPNFEAAAIAGKIQWLHAHFRQYYANHFFGRNKARLAHEKAILIDDDIRNIRWFERRGGQGILVPRPWNDEHNYPTATRCIASSLKTLEDY
jgi:5'(3')-deoxyribonucleotidase